MKTIYLMNTVGLALIFSACCAGPLPKPAPIIISARDGGIPGSLEVQACVQLTSFGCPEAQDVNGVDCPARFRSYIASPYLGIDAACVVKTLRSDELAKCGIRCAR